MLSFPTPNKRELYARKKEKRKSIPEPSDYSDYSPYYYFRLKHKIKIIA